MTKVIHDYIKAAAAVAEARIIGEEFRLRFGGGLVNFGWAPDGLVIEILGWTGTKLVGGGMVPYAELEQETS